MESIICQIILYAFFILALIGAFCFVITMLMMIIVEAVKEWVERKEELTSIFKKKGKIL